MIDTVPATVKLTEPIVATDIKPYIGGLFLRDDGNISFTGQIRIRTSPDTGRVPSDLSVRLTYADRNGNGSNSITTRRATFQGGTATGLWRETFHFWEFNSIISPDVGISKFYIHVTKTSTGETVTHDNAGNGYPASDVVLYQQSQSCVRDPVDGKLALTVKALVRKDRAPAAAGGLTLDLVREIRRQGVIVPKLEVETIDFQPAGQDRGRWAVYTAGADLDLLGRSTSFDIKLGGDDPVEVAFQKTTGLGSNVCS